MTLAKPLTIDAARRLRLIASAIAEGMTWQEAAVHFGCSKRLVAQAAGGLTRVPARARIAKP